MRISCRPKLVVIARHRRGDCGHSAQLVIAKGCLEAIGISRCGHIPGGIVSVNCGVGSRWQTIIDHRTEPVQLVPGERDRDSVRVGRSDTFHVAVGVVSIAQRAFRRRLCRQPIQRVIGVVHGAIASRRGEVLAGGRVGEADRRLSGRRLRELRFCAS